MSRRMLLNANAPRTINVVDSAAKIDFIKAEAGNTAAPKLNVLAYAGGQINLEGFNHPIVIDLSSTVIAPRVPLLWSHDREVILGHLENLTIGSTVAGVGVLSGVGEKAEDVRKMTLSGYQWNVSQGTESKDFEFVPAGEKRTINGQAFTGPFYHAKNNIVREVSILSIGADENAFATLLAASFFKGAFQMTFEEWLKSLGIDTTTLPEAEKGIAQRIYDSLPNEVDAEGKAKVDAAGKNLKKVDAKTLPVVKPVATDVNASLDDFAAKMRQRAADEQSRIDKINTIASGYGNPTMLVAGAKVNIAAAAIKEGWDEHRLENACMKNARPTSINAGGRNGNDGGQGANKFTVLSAALSITSKLSDKELTKQFKPEILDAAHKQYKGRLGIQQLLLEAAMANGYTGSISFKPNMRAILQAAFSTIDVPELLTSSVNKNLRDGFMSVDDSWRKLAAINSVGDFKESYGYRGIGSFRFDKVAPDGQIPHGTMQQANYGNVAETYGKMLGITRKDLINDDIGILTSVPKGLGRGGALALLFAFWTEFMDNSAFFVAGNNNVTTGALGISGLAAAVAKFDKQTDEAGDYIFATPKYLVVPVELKPQADDLYRQTNLVGGGTTVFGENRYVGKYEPVTSPYLSDSRFTGNSTTAFYLLADPNDVPVIEVVFLDGVETPTVETADVDFDQLGIQMRGFFDFGVRKQEPRGGVRSTGV